jgi:hypothetical protein
LISGNLDRRRRALFWSALASAIIHLIVLTLLFYAVSRILITRGSREIVSQTQTTTIERFVQPRKATVAARPHRTVRRPESAPSKIEHHELARIVTTAASPQPPQHPTVPSNIERDTAGYAKEVAKLNALDDPHALPTIDPASQGSTMKSYAFNIPSSLRGSEEGNGIITPTQSWHDAGRDCYYGRYEFTYPDGAMESGNIVWPFCFDPASDPFKQPPHPIPFPLPVAGWKLTSDDPMPPIEKSVYQQWASETGASPSTP